jgi:hypothetical protein
MYGSANVSFEALKELYFGYRNTVVTKTPWPIALDWILRPLDEYSTPQFNLWNRLYQSRNCLAIDPRDKVFALKSLIGSEQSDMDFLINYAQSVEECFTQVATFLLPVLGLRMLTAIRHPHEKAMSSWIPDWSENPPLDFRHFNEPLGAERDQPVSSPGSPDEQKHTTRPFSYRVNKTRQELLVVGL